MNREVITQSLLKIKSSITTELELRADDKLKDNYMHGIKLCDDMLARVADTTLAITANTLLSKFDRYTSDSLPWTGNILKTIDAQTKIILKECKIK